MGIGTRIGSYEILGALGAGGMGEVYRARDTRLDRDVAIKLLPETFSRDQDRLLRFEREAKTLAALNHPHIASIYGVEETNGVRALVLELVEGPTLADRIAEGPIPLDDALPIAAQIAEALEAAHEKGIIHRDLKPANVKLRPDGTVKVLDFGLAKAFNSADASTAAGLSQSPTITTPAGTGIGVILGTAAYMAPEQARGRVVDKRADVWAFGCVLCEMLTGARVFAADDVTDTIAAIVRAEPDWTQLPRNTPASILRLLRRCLEKDPRLRLPDIGSARLEIRDASRPEPTSTTSQVRSPNRERIRWLAALVAISAAAAIVAGLFVRWTIDPASEIRVEITTPPTQDAVSLAFSPDGGQIVFVGTGDDGLSRLWRRSLRTLEWQPLGGTEGAAFPFWSPDSRSLAFFAAGKLKRLDLAAGAPQTLADANLGRGGTWNADDTILFAPANAGGLVRISASGGEILQVTKPADRTNHRFPHFLPDARHFLFFVGGTDEQRRGLYLGSLDSADVRRLTTADSAGQYIAPGWVVFVRQDMLLAQRLDLDQQELIGDPIMLAEAVGRDPSLDAGAFSVARTGNLVYRSGVGQRQLTWFNRAGRAEESVGPPDSANLTVVELSPDGRRVAVHRTVQKNVDVWVLDNARRTRFTFDAAADSYPVWSPDSGFLFFDSNRTGTRHVYRKAASGGGADELIMDTPKTGKAVNDVSPDGRYALLYVQDPETQVDLWIAPLADKSAPVPFVNSPFDERGGQFSPDGRWISYMSTESGRYEIYVRPFPKAAGQWQVSTDGGIQARWAPDGKELYYVAPDGTLMAVPVTAATATFQAGTPIKLFRSSIWGGGTNFAARTQYDVGPDGRFLINVSTDQTTSSPITLLLNWNPDRQN